MTTMSDSLEALKRQVEEASIQEYQINQQQHELKLHDAAIQVEKNQVDEEMKSLILSITGQAALSEARDKEILKDKLDAFSIKQQAMTREIITLNDMLASTDALEALYSAKRKELDLNYRNQENALRRQIKALEERIETQREESGKLDKEIDRKKEDIQLIEEHLKDRKFWDGMKKTWLDHWLPMLTAGFLAVFLGGFFGWGTYGIANEIFKGLVNLIKG
ncbi:hypothetical protein [Faecalibaculum rodentium]|uniref:Uncharacterized protein n=1 Tax=Faecalibaculum rodentium TaxID=1702221 RepID=A0A1Q9YMS2_9FIRM|nr:hypothetical protein [Faecalibaculum rodentium]OLU46818.1 hypothetical protein BO223_01625 [Faecalibaculum rodentium]